MPSAKELARASAEAAAGLRDYQAIALAARAEMDDIVVRSRAAIELTYDLIAQADLMMLWGGACAKVAPPSSTTARARAGRRRI